ncbi:hypothetical protein GJ496_005855 [Pomphorhynchus laevis]|nr:hypothetical protein GJ496_005855 [Pomphorhynchus laevis]
MTRGKPSSTARCCGCNGRAARCLRCPCRKSNQPCIDCLASHCTNKTQSKNHVFGRKSQSDDINSVSDSISSPLITTLDTSVKLHPTATSDNVSSIDFHQ